MIRIGVSQTIHDVIKAGTVVGPDNISVMDVTLLLPEDDGLWVDNAYRRLRPCFVESVDDARAQYKQLITMSEMI